MEVYQIRVFLEVARHLSFTEASDVLNLTQPAVSAKIKSLEIEIGTPLFHRLGRKIQLTDVGKFLLDNGSKLIDIENDLLQEIEHIKKGKSGILKIGCTSEIANGWLPTKLFNNICLLESCYSCSLARSMIKTLRLDVSDILKFIKKNNFVEDF